eukprot:15326477-Alexandrium_andersonii.AAC.1
MFTYGVAVTHVPQRSFAIVRSKLANAIDPRAARHRTPEVLLAAVAPGLDPQVAVRLARVLSFRRARAKIP